MSYWSISLVSEVNLYQPDSFPSFRRPFKQYHTDIHAHTQTKPHLSYCTSTQHIITNYRHYKLKKPNTVSWFNSVTVLFFFLLASYLINLNVTDLSCCRQVFWSSCFVKCDHPYCLLSWLTWCGPSYLSASVCICIKGPEAACQRCNDWVWVLRAWSLSPENDWR